MKIKLLILFLLLAGKLLSQDYSNLKKKNIEYSNDTILLDSTLIVPGSFRLYRNQHLISDSLYFLNLKRSSIYLSQYLPKDSSRFIAYYRTFPRALNNEIYRNDIYSVNKINNAIRIQPGKKASLLQKNDFGTNIQKNGSISRGITIGNNQDAVVNSNLNLQLNGKLSDKFKIMAAISDKKIPIQPDGNSQQIQDFDRVFIQIYSDNSKLIAGDFEQSNQVGRFSQMYRKVQGGYFETSQKNKRNTFEITSSISASVSKGKYARKSFIGQEGNLGPYRLTGANNELYIIILAGSEKVYLNGQLLTRGKDNDYVIDYNNGELSFTPKNHITKDSRIAIEFEYSEQSYARFLISGNNLIETQKGKFWINISTEQDSKNQPLSQDLNDQQKRLLAQVGDDLSSAVIINADSTSFRNDIVLYQKKDTIGLNGNNYEIFKYSTDPEQAFYQVGFSYVGANKGNYVRIESSANGKVYAWQSPINGIPQGDYEPIRILTAPQNMQVINAGGDFNITKTTHSKIDMALSNNDVNTFSNEDSEDNIGYAIDLQLKQNFYLSDSAKNKLSTSVYYQLIDKNFTTFERFKEIEFERNWNINTPILEDEQMIGLDLQYQLKNNLISKIGYKNLSYADSYRGDKGFGSITSNFGSFNIDLSGSYLSTEEDLNSTGFYRYNGILSKSFKHIKFNILTNYEKNQWKDKSNDSLLNNSYSFTEWKFELTNSDSSINQYTAHFKLRNDFLPLGNKLKSATHANEYGLSTILKKNKNSRLRANINYRELEIVDTSLTNIKNENSLSGKFDYLIKLFKGAITSKTYFEIGSGLEPIREYSYLEVAQGQGIYQWIDYNNNNIKELDEFEVANFQDQAKYIRISTPGNEYSKVYSNEFNENITILLNRLLKKDTKFNKFAGRFSNQFSFQQKQKNSLDNFIDGINPFQDINDSSLISLNSSYRNTLSFNKSNRKWGLDYIYQYRHNRNLLSNGFEEKQNKLHGLKSRIRITKSLTLLDYAFISQKENNYELFTHKNYSISSVNNEFTFRFEPGYRFSWDIDYKYHNLENIKGSEKTEKHDLGSKLRYSFKKIGAFNAQINLIYISYNSETNTPIANDLLAGLKPGTNLTWSLLFTQKLANGLEININYNGRSSEGSKVIHTGNAQIRAYF